MDFKKQNNTPPTTYTLLYTGVLLMLLAVLLTMLSAQPTHAKTNENKEVGENKSEIKAQEADDLEAVDKKETDESGRQEEQPTTPSPVSPAPVNNEAEAILNQVIPAPEPATTSPSLPEAVLAPAPASTTPETTVEEPTPVIKPSQSTSTTRRNRPARAETPATTTPIQGSTDTTGGSAESTITLLPQTGGQSTVAATNYYTPLDDLSPTVTYTLSALALALGIAGILLFMNSPRTREETMWVPHLRTGDTLLET